MLQSRTTILALIIIFVFINFIYKFQNFRARFIIIFFNFNTNILFSTYPILQKIIVKNEIENINIKELKKIDNQKSRVEFENLLKKKKKIC